MNHDIPEVIYLDVVQKDTAIILDLPGYESINEGLALAKTGWRPIPLYNGTYEQNGAMALVNNHVINYSLLWGAGVLKSMELDDDAPPVFLLDSNRTHRFKMNVSVFDNSWDIYKQDLPTAKYFIQNGIKKIIVRGDKIHNDLSLILHKFQNKGISIMFTNGFDTPEEIVIKEPSRKKEKEN